MFRLVTVWRSLRLAEHLITGLGLALGIAATGLTGHRPAWVPRVVRWWYGRACRILGLHIAVSGTPAPAALLVANHVSWLDVLVLGAQGEVSFLSKAEVRQWPVIGWIAEVIGTLFIARGAHQTAQVTTTIGERVRRGQPVVLFPEGTTSDGSELLHFHPRLFAIGQQPDIPIQPVALRYGAGPIPDPIAPFIGEDTLLAHLLRLLRHEGLVVQVAFLPPLVPDRSERRRLAEQARTAIALALGIDPATEPRPRTAFAAPRKDVELLPALLRPGEQVVE